MGGSVCRVMSCWMATMPSVRDLCTSAGVLYGSASQCALSVRHWLAETYKTPAEVKWYRDDGIVAIQQLIIRHTKPSKLRGSSKVPFILNFMYQFTQNPRVEIIRVIKINSIFSVIAMLAMISLYSQRMTTAKASMFRHRQCLHTIRTEHVAVTAFATTSNTYCRKNLSKQSGHPQSFRQESLSP